MSKLYGYIKNKENGESQFVENWDNRGRIYYTNKHGNKVKPQSDISLFQQLKNKSQATADNVSQWINKTNPESEAYKQKINTIIALGTLPFGLGPTATKWVGAKLVPVFGKKIGQHVAKGMGGGLVGGSAEGFGRGLTEDENPFKTAAIDGTMGMLGGTAFGLGSGKVLRAIDKYNNPWFVDEGLQNNENMLKYLYDKVFSKNNKRLPKVETSKVIENLRMESGMPNGRGAYTQRSYANPRHGVIAQYYPTKELKNNFKVRNFETLKYNELLPNNNDTARLYYDTLKSIKEKFGKKYDTVSLHPVEDYKNMRLFLAPDKSSGFAIQPDGDIVSVFGSKKGSGSSHSMLELALQNKGNKLNNYDVPDLRNIYNNHKFEITERTPWNDEYWNPKEWDKAFMLSS